MLKPTIQDKILFPDILWQRPINIYQKRGSILVLGEEKNINNVLRIVEVLHCLHLKKVSLGYPDALDHIYQNFLPNEFRFPIPSTPNKTFSFSAYETIKEALKDYDLLLIGSGLSQNQETQRLIEELVKLKFPVLFEGKGTLILKEINNLGPAIIVFNEKITAHLFKIKDILKNPLSNLQRLSQVIKKVLVFAGEEVFISKPEAIVVTKIRIQSEILAGLIGAFWALNTKKPFESACTGAYIAKVWQENFDKISNIPDAVKIAEKEIERR